MNLILFGAPGSGKGTQSVMLAKTRGLSILSTGEILRLFMDSESGEIAERVRSLIKSGQLVNDDIICEAVLCRMKEIGSNFLFDGFPRNISQAKFLDSVLCDMNQKIDLVIELSVPIDSIKKRILERVLCSSCKQVLNVSAFLSNQKWICANCGCETFDRRSDDVDVSVIETRIDKYFSERDALCDYYSNVLFVIDGQGSVEDVAYDINRKLDLLE